MSELQLKGWLAHALQGIWMDAISPGSGSTFGFPDVGVLVPGTPLYVPIELKLAEVKHSEGGSGIRPLRLRPSQIAWHDGFARAGGYSRILLGMVHPDGGWHAWVMDRPRQEQLKDWRDGIPRNRLLKVTDAGQLDLDAWWRGPRAFWQECVTSAALGQPRQAS